MSLFRNTSEDYMPDRRRSRPRASVGTMINLGILILMMATGGVGVMNYLSAIQRDVAVLQNQMTVVQSQLSELTRRKAFDGGPR